MIAMLSMVMSILAQKCTHLRNLEDVRQSIPDPHFWIHQKKGEKYQKPDGGDTFFLFRLPEDDEYMPGTPPQSYIRFHRIF